MSTDRSTLNRLATLVFSILVMTFVTVLVGYGGWLLLRLSAAVGGPDPRTEEGDLLRNRLLAWPQRNRDFIRSNGRRDFPSRP